MSLENKNVNALRVLAVDMIENAKSGDVIELSFDMNFRTVKGMENPEDEESKNTPARYIDLPQPHHLKS